jgi:hypothetical protein
MNPRTLRTLLEAIAVTACLFVIVGQQSEAGITSKAAMTTFQKGPHSNKTLWVGKSHTAFGGKASAIDSDTDEVVED